MTYILDTANIEKIRHCIEFYPIDGVTTNPTIISRERDADFKDLILSIKKEIGERMLHIQITATTAAEIVREAQALQELVGDKLFVKIPISPEGIKATMMLKSMGFGVTETAIFTQQQALMAAKAGADYVAPYVNRLDNIVSDGVNVVREIVEMFELHHMSCKVLAASFKTVEQVHKIAMTGCQAATLNPELLEQLIYHPLTFYAIDDFAADWKTVYGNKGILDLLK
jgi:Transaldolase